jgi:hypothetical protein
MLAGDAFNPNGVDSNGVEPREKALRSLTVRIAIFLDQDFGKELLFVLLVDDSNEPKYTNASISEARVAFESPVVENALIFVEFETNALVALNIFAQVPLRAARMQIDLSIDP